MTNRRHLFRQMRERVKTMQKMKNDALARHLCNSMSSCDACPVNKSENPLECQKSLAEWLGQKVKKGEHT